ncbi:TIGR04100 family radical SAM protein [Aminicella lysinilytica]|uniref:Radical SAM enzyme (TIGR04100 family) n=1 Tax=Aminicella lysinilytica TaxID=433323 RepID=A0A4R6PYD6_9FIRM|nr:TIGR04100 family radical SAM protein [Aminicella lysinilytica]NLD11478.1 TIGR04100 family radical SAM protein [Clostridiales bacterium]TDP47382.1 radical SAM enzyme (TIGR04100 family) [Aminicella lysinilytica]
MDLTEEIGDVLYDYGRGLYANITNRCPCRCEFCIRNMTDALGSADSLWLKREPTVEEVEKMLKDWDLSCYDELVFCGYGEPMERLDDLLEIARYIKKNTDLTVRINTNGLSDLINGKETAPMLEGVIDAVSVSLNQSDAEKYNDLCHPEFGMDAYPAMLKFTEDVKKFVPRVAMSVVGVIPTSDIEKCRKITEKLEVPFRVR